MGSSEGESIESMESIEGLAKGNVGREKRITAGNRLQALLDEEFVAESIFDVTDEQDDDFEGEKNQLQDIEISESDEEESNDSSDGGEDREIERMEKKTKKRKPPEAFFKRRIEPKRVKKSEEVKKSEKKGISVVHPESIRHSLRAHAIENKNMIDHRLKESSKRRFKQNSYGKMKEKQMTQEERIAEAKITEEKNKELLQKLIKVEEERKRNARSLLKTNKPLTSPFIRFLSKSIEQCMDEKVFSKEEEVNQGKYICTNEENTEKTIENDNDSNNQLLDLSKDNSKILEGNMTKNNKEIISNEDIIKDSISLQENNENSISIHTNDKPSKKIYNKMATIPTKNSQKHISRNYIILEGFSEPFDLNKQKNILFSHTEPCIQPKKNFCLITGRIAKYKDPFSGLYYSDLSTYQTIYRILRGEIPWSRIVGTFVSTLKPANGVPNNFQY